MDGKLKSIREEEEKTHAPDSWNAPKEAEKILKAIKQKKNWTEAFAKVNSSFEDLAVLYDFFKSGDATEKEVGHPLLRLLSRDYRS